MVRVLLSICASHSRACNNRYIYEKISGKEITVAGERVGTVAAIYRYLVKSMRGEAVEKARLWWTGVEGDRRYAFMRAGNTSHFPWLTGRTLPALLQYTPYLLDATDPMKGAVQVRTPDGATVAIEHDALRDELAALHGAPLHLVQNGRGMFDSAPLSVLSMGTLAVLGEDVGYALDPRRFRPNIVITADVPETAWIGGLLTFGEEGEGADGAAIRLNRPDQRCVMITLDPNGAPADPTVLKAVARYSRDVCAGAYASTERIGMVRVGDSVYLQG